MGRNEILGVVGVQCRCTWNVEGAMASVLEKNKVLQLTKQQFHTAVLNPQGSKQFLKKIVPMSVSFILHQRVQFAEKDFQTRTLDGVQYKVFKPKLQNLTLQQIRKWVNSALQALDSNYLRELYLILANPDDPDDIFESYKFQFKYMGDDAIDLDMLSTETDLVKSTETFLKAIESLEEHTKYKELELDIKMAVTYYEDVTPTDYNPPGYNNNEDSAKVILRSLEKQSPNYLQIGMLKTGHHIVKCRGKADLFSLNQSHSSSNLADQLLEESNHKNAETEENCGDRGLQQETKFQNSQEAETQNQLQPEIQDSEETNFQINTQELQEFDRRNTQTPTVSELSENEVICIHDDDVQCFCKISSSFRFIGEIMCSQCLGVQHCVCLGYLSENDVPSPYVCEICAGEWNYTPVSEQKKKLLCTYRLAVAVAYFTQSFPEEMLTELPTELKEWAVTKLKQCKVVKKQSDGQYIVNMELLKNSYIKGIFSNSFSKKRKAENPISEEKPNKMEEIEQKMEKNV